MKKTLLALATALLISTPAMAAEPTKSYTNDEGARVDLYGDIYNPDKKVITFVDGDTLEGEVLSANGENIFSQRGLYHTSLIPIRMSFVDRLIKLSWDAPAPMIR